MNKYISCDVLKSFNFLFIQIAYPPPPLAKIVVTYLGYSDLLRAIKMLLRIQ